MSTEQVTGHRTVGTADLVVDLRRIIRRGLPATLASAGDVLPHLRSVVGRAIHPDDRFGRLDSLNLTLERLIVELEDERFGGAARLLFGLTDASRGTTLTVRRQLCAKYLEYDFDHFRKRIEIRILELVAEALHRDLVRYRSRLRRPVTACETTRPAPQLEKADLTREEELVCRIWHELYLMRAERIATHLAADESDRQAHRTVEEAAALRLNALADEFVETYGRRYIPLGQLEYAVEGLERLVVWKV